MAEALKFSMNLAEADSRNRPSKKTIVVNERWDRMATMAAMHHGSLMARAEVPNWLGWLDIGDYKPAHFTGERHLVLSGWETERINPKFVRKGNTVVLSAMGEQYRTQVCPGHALITPYDSEEGSMTPQKPLFMDCDMPWWEEPTSPSLAEELKGFAMAIYREARNMCADRESAGEDAEPFFTPLKLSVRLEGPVLSIEAWTYYGTICKLNTEEDTNG